MSRQRKKQRQELLKRKERCEAILKDHLSCPEHVYPTTRRQFLETGLITFAASLTLPSLLSGLLNKAHAQASGCAGVGDTSSDLPGFITVALAGGAGLMGQVQYSELNGNPLPSYRAHGVGANPQTEELMGATFFTRSFFARGLKSVLEEQDGLGVLDKTQLLAVPCNNADDTSNNEQDVSGLILQLGKTGKHFQNTGTNNNSPGKLFHQPVMQTPPVALQVRGLRDLESAVALSGQISSLSDQQSLRLAKFVSRLSESQARRLAMETQNGRDLQRVIKCATDENIALLQGGVAGLDPTQDAALRGIWNLQTNNARNGFSGGQPEGTGTRATTAALTQATLTGNAGPVGIVLGGYDYHAGATRAAADAKDQDFGRMVGRILLHAQHAQKKIAIYVPTDGSVNAPNEDGSDSEPWTGDRGGFGSFWLILFDPAGRPALNDNPFGGPNWQIGGFTRSSVDTSFFTGNSSALAAAALAANYGHFAGQSEAVSRVFGGRFTASQLDMISRAS